MAPCTIKWCGKCSKSSNFKKDGITFHRVQKIDHDHLKILIDSQFVAIKNTVVEWLEAESQSQGEEPAKEAPRPALRSTLQAAEDAGALQPPAPSTPLAQRGSRLDDDLPLSGEHNPVPSVERAEEVQVDKRKAESERPPPKFFATKRSKLMMAQKNKEP